MRAIFNKLFRIFANSLMIGSFVYAVYRFCHSPDSGKPFVAIYNIFISFAFAILSAFLFIRLHLLHVAEFFADMLLLPHKKFKKIQISLSPALGYMANGNYQAAIDFITKVLDDTPHFLLPNYLLFKVYMDKLEDYNQAYVVAQSYYSRKDRIADEQGLEFLFRFSDLLTDAKCSEENTNLLENEARNSIYSKREQAIIRERLSTLNLHTD